MSRKHRKRLCFTFLVLMAASVSLSGCRKKTPEARESEVSTASNAEQEEALIPEETLPESSQMGTAALIDYKNTVVQEPQPEAVTDEEVDAEIEAVLFEQAESVTNRPIAEGDTVNISYTASIAGVPVDNGASTETSFLWGDKEAIREEFYQAIEGASCGDVRESVIHYPEDYGVEALNGNDVTYTITITDVTEDHELTDELAARLSETGAATVKDYREEIRNRLYARKEEQARFQAAYDLLDRIIDQSGFSVSEAFQDEMYADYDASFEKWLEESGMTLEEYKTAYGKNDGQLAIEREDTATANARFLTAAQIIIEEEGLTADNEAVKGYWNRAFGSEISDGQITDRYQGQELAQIRTTAAVMNYLMDIVHVEYLDAGEGDSEVAPSQTE